MIKSMTGYGKSELEVEERKYQVEIKSVNHRYLDISVKMPKQIIYKAIPNPSSSLRIFPLSPYSKS